MPAADAADTSHKGVRHAAKKDHKRVLKLNMSRANGGDRVAQHKLGLRFLRGDGVEQDNAAATHWLRQAAEQGCEQSLRLLEQLHIHTVAVSEHQPRSSHNAGSGGEEHNERKALGQAELQRGLELVFSKSYGDAIEAFRAAHAALGPNDTLAAYNMACCYALQGQVDSAAHWLTKAVEAGMTYEELLHDPDHTAIFADRRYEEVLDVASMRQTEARGKARVAKAAARHAARASAEQAVVRRFDRTKDYVASCSAALSAAEAADNAYKLRGLGHRPLLLAASVAYQAAEKEIVEALEQPTQRVPAANRSTLRKQLQDVQRRFDALTGKAAAMGCSEFEQTLEAARSAAAAERQAMILSEAEFLMRTWDADYEAQQLRGAAHAAAVAHNMEVTTSAMSAFNAVRDERGPDWATQYLLANSVRTEELLTEAESARRAEKQAATQDAAVVGARDDGSTDLTEPAFPLVASPMTDSAAATAPDAADLRNVRALPEQQDASVHVATEEIKNETMMKALPVRNKTRSSAVAQLSRQKPPPGFGYGRREPGRGKPLLDRASAASHISMSNSSADPPELEDCENSPEVAAVLPTASVDGESARSKTATAAVKLSKEQRKETALEHQEALLVEQWQAACPAFASPAHDAAALAALLLWRFPAAHEVTVPLVDAQWADLLARLREDADPITAPAQAVATLGRHAPTAVVSALLDHLCAQYCTSRHDSRVSVADGSRRIPPPTRDQIEEAMVLLQHHGYRVAPGSPLRRTLAKSEQLGHSSLASTDGESKAQMLVVEEPAAVSTTTKFPPLLYGCDERRGQGMGDEKHEEPSEAEIRRCRAAKMRMTAVAITLKPRLPVIAMGTNPKSQPQLSLTEERDTRVPLHVGSRFATNAWGWDVETVSRWLREVVKLPGQHIDNFVRNEVDGETLLELSDEEMKNDLNIGSLGHRKMLANGIRSLKEAL